MYFFSNFSAYHFLAFFWIDFLPENDAQGSPKGRQNDVKIMKEIDYYFTNSIARSSKTMSDCRAARSENLTSKKGT